MTDHPNQRPDNLPRGAEPTGNDQIEELIAFLFPVIDGLLARIETDGEFTTSQFIEVLRSDPEADATYLEAIRRWGEGEHYGKMVIHGQVIPGAMRRSPRVEWSGYAHGEADDYGVPAWWKMSSQQP